MHQVPMYQNVCPFSMLVRAISANVPECLSLCHFGRCIRCQCIHVGTCHKCQCSRLLIPVQCWYMKQVPIFQNVCPRFMFECATGANILGRLPLFHVCMCQRCQCFRMCLCALSGLAIGANISECLSPFYV